MEGMTIERNWELVRGLSMEGTGSEKKQWDED